MNKILITSILFGVMILAGCPGGGDQIQGCTPDWQCSDWSACSNELQTRTCTDINTCGVTTNKPAESQACTTKEEWIAYNFKGGEHFKFNIKLNDTESGMLEGYLVWDIGQKTENNEFPMTFNMSIGGDECIASMTTRGDEITEIQADMLANPACFAGLTLLSFTIYSPYWADISDRGLESWSYGAMGFTIAFTVDPTPKNYAGLSCTSGALSRNQVTVFELCASRELGLGLAMTLRDDTGGLMYDAELVEYS